MRLRDGPRLNTAHAEFGPNQHRESAPHFSKQGPGNSIEVKYEC